MTARRPEGRGRSEEGIVADTTNDTDERRTYRRRRGLAGTNPRKADSDMDGILRRRGTCPRHQSKQIR